MVAERASTISVVGSALSMGKMGGRPWRALEDALRRAGIRYDVRKTESAGHAVDLAREAAHAGASLVVAAGGDGTIAEVVTGLMAVPAEQRPDMGILPLGRGNDFVRALPFNGDADEAVRRLSGSAHALDVGRMRCASRDRDEREMYFINLGSIGFAANVTEAVARYGRNMGGTWPYVRGLVASLAAWRNRRACVTVDGTPHDQTIFTVNVANGRFYGGGMHAAPRAVMDDGLFDVVIMEGLSMLEVFRYMPNNYSGKFDSIAKIKQIRGREVTVTTDEPMLVQLDGDVVGITPARFDLVPGAIRLRY